MNKAKKQATTWVITKWLPNTLFKAKAELFSCFSCWSFCNRCFSRSCTLT